MTDVGSTKGAVARAGSSNARFIGGHPVCGSEARGPAHARAELFDGATWFLTPVARPTPSATATLHAFVAVARRRAGRGRSRRARPARRADEPPAARAREPARQPGGRVRVEGHEPLAAAGGSLRDMTRVAGANPRIWVDIFLDNRRRGRGGARRAPPPDRAGRGRARGGRRGVPRPLDRRGAGNRRRMLDDAYEDPGALQRLRVHVPDRPGVLAGITQALGAERINIEDFELQHHSPSAAGRSPSSSRARRPRARPPLLEAQGYGVVVSPVMEYALRVCDRRGSRAQRRLSRSRICRRRFAICEEHEHDHGRAAHGSSGHIAVPGDKSISHRAVLLGALARARPRSTASDARERHRVDDRPAVARSASTSTSTTSTCCACTASGCAGCARRRRPIDCRNAGTLMRLLAGVLAGQEGRFELDGDDVALGRPMERVAEPLREMGARRDDGRARAARDRGRGTVADPTTSCRSRARR